MTEFVVIISVKAAGRSIRQRYDISCDCELMD